MKILSIGKEITYEGLNIVSIEASELNERQDIESYDHIIINGGDGSIRRVLKELHNLKSPPKFILNPTGSFNLIAKLHHISDIDTILQKLASGEPLRVEKHHMFHINDDIFLFSAGNMGDLQHIFLSETFRFGWLKDGIGKYLLALFFLLPMHLIMTPFMLMSSRHFFVFTPMRFIKKCGTFYGEVNQIDIDLGSEYNLVELDGDIVTLKGKKVHIAPAGHVPIVLG